MPFPQQTPRPFTSADIQQVNPGQTGVYGIFRKDVWIYVGRGDIRDRMLRHVNGDNPAITASLPTHWVSEVTANDIQRERELILELGPTCNQRAG